MGGKGREGEGRGMEATNLEVVLLNQRRPGCAPLRVSTCSNTFALYSIFLPPHLSNSPLYIIFCTIVSQKQASMGDSPPCSLPAIDENADMSSSHVASSPPAMLEYISSKKPKKPPPITPKRFTRFFTPRTNATTSSSSRLSSKSGRQLRDITRNGANRGNVSSRHSASRKRVLFEDIKSQEDAENVGGQTPRLSPRKRRKGLLTPDSSPPQSSPLKQRRSYSPEVVLQGEQEVEERASTRSIAISPSPEPVFPQPARRLNCSGINGRVVSRSFGEGRRKDHCASWEHQSSDFYSLPEYRHQYVSPCLPFCAASGHYNDLVAIGDESGAVTCINSTDHSIGT